MALISLGDTVLLHNIATWEWLTVAIITVGVIYIFVAPYLGIALLYNKFGTEKSLNTCGNLGCFSKRASGKNAYVIVYSVPLCVLMFDLIAVIILFDESPILIFSFKSTVIFTMLLFHFVKRILESLYVHILTKEMNYLLISLICCWYSFGSVASYTSVLTSLVITDINSKNDGDMYSQSIMISNDSTMIYAGIVFYTIGQCGNFYIHYKLAQSRKAMMMQMGNKLKINNLKKEYIHPYDISKCFEISYCPHYVFEICGTWFGVFLVARTVSTLMCFIGYTTYLSYKGTKTSKWYQNESNTIRLQKNKKE